MFGFLKKLTGRPEHPKPAPAAAKSAAPAPARPAPAAPQAPQPASAPAAKTASDVLRISLRSVVAALPDKLKVVVAHPPGDSDTVSVPRALAIEHLPKGAVTLTLEQIQINSTPSVFSVPPELLSTEVALPLGEILQHLSPRQFTRRADQRKITVPEDITSLFGPKGQALRRPAAAEPAAPTSVAPAPAPVTVAPPPPPTPAPAKVEPVVAAPPAPVPIPSPAPIKLVPPAPAPEAPIRMAPVPAAPVLPSPASGPSTQTGTKLVSVPFSALAEAWTGPAKPEIESIASYTLDLPFEEVEIGMKKGKLSFSWAQLRPWIRNAPSTISGLLPDQTQLDLPIKPIMPLFMAKRLPAKPQKKYQIGDNIPNLFSGNPAAAPVAPAAVPVAAPVPVTPAAPAPAAPVAVAPASLSHPPAPPVPKFAPPAAPVPPPPAPVPLPMPPAPSVAPVPKPILQFGEIFGQPDKLEWTLAEVVQKTSTLRGVAGALVVMPDGLAVTARLPAGMVTDTVAAFVPQLYGRIGQCAREFKLADPGHVTVFLENLPVQIFKAGNVFFAILGRDGETLPKAQLQAIAARIARQSAPAQ